MSKVLRGYNSKIFRFGAAVLVCLLQTGDYAAKAQLVAPGSTPTLNTAPQRDTSNPTNTNTWRDESTAISYKRWNSEKTFYPDTSLHFFHRNELFGTWTRDLGNLGAPLQDLLFHSSLQPGPTLGYTIFDGYRFQIDSLLFYNTTRPYSAFSYSLGSKAEQIAQILHTQNVNPRWNFAAQYRKLNSPGYFLIQRNNADMASLTTNYSGPRQHYRLNAAFAYNKIQHDENGGIIADSFLNNGAYSDRRTIPVLFQNNQYSSRRSSVTTLFRDACFQLMHSYALGVTDTLFNEDSTHYSLRLTPRFSVGHRLKMISQKYQFKDLRPSTSDYDFLFHRDFVSGDSVFTQQSWFEADNALLLNGFSGKREKQLRFTAGVGTKVDNFETDFGTGKVNEQEINNYLEGDLQKEGAHQNEWNYNAKALFFFTGKAVGNFLLNAQASKLINKKIGALSAGVEQQLNSAPYNFRIYQNTFYRESEDYNKETVTQLYATLDNDYLNLRGGLINFLITNFIYLDENRHFNQYTSAFNLTQIWLQKDFRYGMFVLDNQMVYQQKTTGAPINVPTFMGRHQLSLETRLFRSRLQIATGIDVWWHSNYAPSGYAPLFGRFFYQQQYTVHNIPQTAVFFNFRLKNFRAFVMGDQLQQLFSRNNIIAAGYPAQNAMIRFGFHWVMIN